MRQRGAGTQGEVLQLLRGAVEGWFHEPRHGVHLSICVALLSGEQGSIGCHPATTFESIRNFSGADFDTSAAWEQVAQTAVASTTLPLIYAPYTLDGVGDCMDGGIVNNTPIKQAIDGGKIDRVIVVSTEPSRILPRPRPQGVALLSEIIEILLNERLYRDLRQAESINQQLKQLEGLVAAGALSEQAASAVRGSFRWRHLEIIQIRPERALRGSSVQGFSDAALREEYIALGKARAEAVLK